MFSLLRNVRPGVSLVPGARLLIGDRSGQVCYAEVITERLGSVEMVLKEGTFRPRLGMEGTNSIIGWAGGAGGVDHPCGLPQPAGHG